MKNVTLVLEDGTRFLGQSFGHDAPVAGEVVFNTAMTGYPESLTDPSFAGQIMVLTYPLVGNYGVPAFATLSTDIPSLAESDRIQVRALVVTDYSAEYSHWNAKETLAEWLKREKITAITGVDTRQLTKTLREKGVMMGKIIFDDDPDNISTACYEGVNFVAQVSCKTPVRYHEGRGKKVVLVDCGVKDDVLRCLIKRDVEIIRVPWNYDYTAIEHDGVVISNGPGDPNECGEAVEVLRKQMADSPTTPILGIGIGHQLLAMAAGAKVVKMKYGHRSHNQPVREVGTEKCYITTQNHGYTVDTSMLASDWRELFVNMNDGSNEGICHNVNPWMSSQFHPEVCADSKEAEFMFDRFVESL